MIIKIFTLIKHYSLALWLTKLTRNVGVRKKSTSTRLHYTGSKIRHKNFIMVGKFMLPPLALYGLKLQKESCPHPLPGAS
jgi:hypothetical protein